MYYKSGQTCVTIWGSFVLLQIRQTLLQIGAASLLQIKASVVTNWGSYYKLGKPLLQNRAAITIWAKMYYKLGEVLQIRAIIINWGITTISLICNFTKLLVDNNYLMYSREITVLHLLSIPPPRNKYILSYYL